MESIKKVPPVFSDFLFWDSDPEQIDYERDKSYVIRRVFDMGRLGDVAEAMRYYPNEVLTSVLTAATYLPENAVWLAAALFNLKPSDFKCSTSTPYPYLAD